mmetsp:Transcript_19952/g.32885  ORF Transcript_19952/g.32885 Transcript_19952/m.32885 type:complete len:292 (+) Transcript_19952:383-1258(+)
MKVYLALIGFIGCANGQPGGDQIKCPDNGGYTGHLTKYDTSQGPVAAPLRGPVACVDSPQRVYAHGKSQVASLIYGPMEAGFSAEQLSMLFDCTSSTPVPAGLDTNLAERMLHHVCGESTQTVLDYCGGHAMPYHYHEKMTCLYNSSSNGHSTRIGTTLDGKGLYGKFIDGGQLPTDLDACGGRYGIPPGETERVYYYVLQEKAPFTVGCFGPVNSVQECRKLYPGCGDDLTKIELGSETVLYDLECPCYENNTNVDPSAAAKAGVSGVNKTCTPTLLILGVIAISSLLSS